MHIPDGLMAPAVSLIGWFEFLAVFAAVLFVSRKTMKERNLPRVAILSAGIFVAQMLNFPIGGGTTGHLVGGALFAMISGPTIAVIGMTVVLLIQGLMFGDGGITALGLNAINMAVIAPLTGWGIYSLLNGLSAKKGAPGKVVKGFVVGAAAWASVFVAAAACAGELAVSYAVSSGTYGIAATVAVPAMLGVHAIIGIGEAVITAGVMVYLWSVSPGSITSAIPGRKAIPGLRGAISSDTARAAIAIIIVFALTLPLYFLYSSQGRDGLEKVMQNAGTSDGRPVISAPFGYGQSYFSALFAGILGFLAVALVATLILKLVRMKAARELEP
jgi:cobalt/nickel transport system permease protein